MWSDVQVIILLLNIAFLLSCQGRNTPLFCYQCLVDDDTLCNANYMRTCPTDQDYDACRTTVTKTGLGSYMIKKDCAHLPCSHSGDIPAKDMYYCRETEDDYTCIYCCTESGCNSEVPERITPNMTLSGGLVLAPYKLTTSEENWPETIFTLLKDNLERYLDLRIQYELGLLDSRVDRTEYKMKKLTRDLVQTSSGVLKNSIEISNVHNKVKDVGVCKSTATVIEALKELIPKKQN